MRTISSKSIGISSTRSAENQNKGCVAEKNFKASSQRETTLEEKEQKGKSGKAL